MGFPSSRGTRGTSRPTRLPPTFGSHEREPSPRSLCIPAAPSARWLLPYSAACGKIASYAEMPSDRKPSVLCADDRRRSTACGTCKAAALKKCAEARRDAVGIPLGIDSQKHEMDVVDQVRPIEPLKHRLRFT